jgi:hypothetical protein
MPNVQRGNEEVRMCSVKWKSCLSAIDLIALRDFGLTLFQNIYHILMYINLVLI